jgi:hypothetical protein
MTRSSATAIALLAACAAIVACGNDDEPGSLAVERTVRGDTVVVRTLGGSAWDTTATLVEELRIGKLDGADHEMFGAVSELAPDGHGGVYVFDDRARALRHYDASGAFTATVGGEGSGPGEYRDVALGLHVRPDGRVLMRDPRNARINVYDADGTPVDHWPVASGLYASNAMVVDTAGEIYLKIMLGRPEPNEPWPIGLLHLSAAGELLDTIPPPPYPGEPESAAGIFGIEKVWEMSPHGDLVVGVNDRYAFEIRKRDGSVVRVEKAWEAVPMHPEERAELEARNEWVRRNDQGDVPPVPHTKPAYSGFSIGGDGRIWVRVRSRSEKVDPGPPPVPRGGQPPAPQVSWREPVIYDVFESDGTYLGPIQLPPRVTLRAHAGDEVWAAVRGEFDEQYVVRYRLVVPGRDHP